MKFKLKERWKEYCNQCDKFHIVSLQPCPDCGRYYTPQPVGETVRALHLDSKYRCDGCDAYQDHLR